MQITSFGLVAFAGLLLVVEAVHLRSASGADQQFFSYDYAQRGQDWMAGSCSSRTSQSPVDLPAIAAMTGAFQYKYKPITAPFDVFNNGHAFSADFAGLGYGGVTYNDAYYGLMNVNVHSLSEHAFTGVRKPLELHLVHKHYATEALLVIAIPVESATPLPKISALQFNTSSSLRKLPKMAAFDATYSAPPSGDAGFNPTLQAFLKATPPAVNMKVSVPVGPDNTFDFNNLLMGAGAYYEYAGSLTAPPCAEIVTWLVRKDPVKASDKQVLYLHDAVYKTTADFGNYRNLMPLNGRVITMKQGMMEDPPRSKPVDVPMGANPQKSDREFKAMKWAMDAMTIAKGATDYIKDLDMRLRNAAQAHADALAPRLEPLGADGKLLTAGGRPTLPPRSSQAIDMENTAKDMARELATAAADEIEDATKKITQKSKEAAMKAAQEASRIVASGQGSNVAMANSVLMPGQPAAATP